MRPDTYRKKTVMNIKTALIAAVVRLVADQTDLIHKPSNGEAFISELFGMETYDVRMARNIEDEVARVANAAKRISTNRKFKKITSNI